MTFRARLLLTSLLTLAVGLGALVVAGNVLLDRLVESETTDMLRARVDAEIAGLAVSASGSRCARRPTTTSSTSGRGCSATVAPWSVLAG